MGSTRLPGKVLMDVSGKPHLTRLVNRIAKSKVDDIIVATTRKPEDDAIADWGAAEGVRVYRGPENDVLGRIVRSQQMMGSDTCVMVWGDCPLIDPYFIDLGIDLAGNADIALGPATRTFPHGVAPHVLRLELLEELEAWTLDPGHREHTTVAFYETPGEYDVAEIHAPPGWDCPGQRLQVDYLQDHLAVSAVCHFLGDDFDTGDVVNLLREKPWIREINRCVP